MGRGEEPHPAAVGFQNRGQHRRGRALAVGAADLGQRVGPFGAPQRVQQGLDALETRTHPGVLATAQGEQPADGLGIRHAGGVG